MVALRQYECVSQDGTVLAAKDVDGLIVAWVPTAGADEDNTANLVDVEGLGNGVLSWPRRIVSTLVDANASITQAKVYISGTVLGGAVVSETLTHVAAGELETSHAYETVTSYITHVDGVVTAVVDTLELGWGDAMALPTRDVGTVAEIRVKRADATIDSGTVTLSPYWTWEPTGGNVPDAALRFYVEIYE